MEERLHRGCGLVQRERELVVGETSELAEEEGVALPARELGELLPQTRDEDALGHEIGRVGPVGGQSVGQRSLGASRGSADARPTLVAGDLGEPGSCVEGPHACAERAIRVQENLLRRVLRLVAVAEEDATQPQDERAMLEKVIAASFVRTVGLRHCGHSSLYPSGARADRSTCYQSVKTPKTALEMTAIRVLA